MDSLLRIWGKAVREGKWGAAVIDDAARVNGALLRLDPTRQRLILMVYSWEADRAVICRRLKIPRSPSAIYDLELAAAKRAIEDALNRQ
ncbi:hypothetical protein WK76_24935 [Burkholderia ubonensis]|nr:hypothetical protein WK76_24935 [Burkholderia ubonensis]